MNKQAYRQGFIDACNYYGLDTNSLVKQGKFNIDNVDPAIPVGALGAGVGAVAGGTLSKKHKIRNAILASIAGGAAGAGGVEAARRFIASRANQGEYSREAATEGLKGLLYHGIPLKETITTLS